MPRFTKRSAHAATTPPSSSHADSTQTNQTLSETSTNASHRTSKINSPLASHSSMTHLIHEKMPMTNTRLPPLQNSEHKQDELNVKRVSEGVSNNDHNVLPSCFAQSDEEVKQQGTTRINVNNNNNNRLCATTIPTTNNTSSNVNRFNVNNSSSNTSMLLPVQPIWMSSSNTCHTHTQYGLDSSSRINTTHINETNSADALHQKRQRIKMHTVGNADTTVARSEKESAVFHLCMEALHEGCVLTYVHLFNLAHRPPLCVDALAQRYFTLSKEKLKWVQEELSSIEVLRRQSEFDEVYVHSLRLADYFEREGDLVEAERLHGMALYYILESLDHTMEQKARNSFAMFFVRTKQWHKAEEIYLSLYRLARAWDEAEAAKEVCVHLVQVYTALGDMERENLRHTRPNASHFTHTNQHAENSNINNTQESSMTQVVSHHTHSAYTAAMKYYESAALYAQKAQASLAEGVAYDALGSIHEQEGNLHHALQLKRSYRRISQQIHARSDECAATLSVASLEERLGLMSDAVNSLSSALSLANELEDDVKLCKAFMQQGEIHRANGECEKALHCFTEAFHAACQSENEELINATRVAMGFASGSYHFKKGKEEDEKKEVHDDKSVIVQVQAAQTDNDKVDSNASSEEEKKLEECEKEHREEEQQELIHQHQEQQHDDASFVQDMKAHLDQGYLPMICNDIRAQLKWLSSGTM